VKRVVPGTAAGPARKALALATQAKKPTVWRMFAIASCFGTYFFIGRIVTKPKTLTTLEFSEKVC
jgi:hypothetical protein